VPRTRGQEISGRIMRLLSAEGNRFTLTESSFYSFSPRLHVLPKINLAIKG
jgi:hypothetical protein